MGNTVLQHSFQRLVGCFGYLTSEAMEWLRKFESDGLHSRHLSHWA